MIYIFQSQINLNKLKGFTTVFLILFIFSPFAYAYVSITETDKRTDYEGKKIADEVQKLWDKNYENKIEIVQGDEWHAGNLSYHLASRPEWHRNINNIIRAKNNGVIGVWSKERRCIGPNIIKENMKICFLND